MKKIKIWLILIIILIIFGVPFSSGCSDEFTTVCSVSYTYGGTTSTQYSKQQKLYSAGVSITKEEYFASPTWQRLGSNFSASSNLSSNFSVPKAAKGLTTYTVTPTKSETDDLKRYNQVYNSMAKKYYYNVFTYKGVKYTFVLVKVVNDSKIIIKNTKGETTYSNCSYSITYFS